MSAREDMLTSKAQMNYSTGQKEEKEEGGMFYHKKRSDMSKELIKVLNL